MEQKKLFRTLRIKYSNEAKLFFVAKDQCLDELKDKVITRFSLHFKREQFELQYFDKKNTLILQLIDLPNQKKIDEKLFEKLALQKVQLIVTKIQTLEQKPVISLKWCQADETGSSLFDQKASKERVKVEKHYAQCDKCLEFPILGIRFKCIICKNYDLCENCYSKLETITKGKSHPFLKIKTPIQEIAGIDVAFNKNDISQMKQCCKTQFQKEKFQHTSFVSQSKEVAYNQLSQKKVQSKNFIEILFNQSCNKRQKSQNHIVNNYFGNINTLFSEF